MGRYASFARAIAECQARRFGHIKHTVPHNSIDIPPEPLLRME